MNRENMDSNDLMFEIQKDLEKEIGCFIAFCYGSASLDGEYTSEELRKIADALDIIDKKRKEETENNHVYCTLCKYGAELIDGILKDEEFNEPTHCIGCCSQNPEDSMPLKERPNYVSLNEK